MPIPDFGSMTDPEKIDFIEKSLYPLTESTMQAMWDGKKFADPWVNAALEDTSPACDCLLSILNFYVDRAGFYWNRDLERYTEIPHNIKLAIHWASEMWIATNLEHFEFYEHQTPLSEVMRVSNKQGIDALEKSESLFWGCVEYRAEELRKYLERKDASANQ